MHAVSGGGSHLLCGHGGHRDPKLGGHSLLCGAAFVCGHPLQRRGLHLADIGSEGLKPHGGVPADEP